jgi:hypothetical protein
VLLRLAVLLLLVAPAARAQPAPTPPRSATLPRLLVLDFSVQGSGARDLGRALGDVAAAEAAAVGGLAVVSQGDVATQLGLERAKQMVGCAEDESCMVEVAGALAAERMLAGTVTVIEGSYLLSVRHVDVRRSRSLSRVGTTLRAPTQAEVVDAVRRLAHEAITGKKLDTTGVVHIEVEEEGADVAVDGRDVGKSPIKAGQRVIEGPHRLTVQKRGYVTWESAIDVGAGASVPVTVKLVPVSAIEAERRVFVEVYAGFTVGPRYAVTTPLNCAGGCVGNMGGVRGGYLFGERYAVELFLVPFMALNRISRRPVTVSVGSHGGVLATAPAWQDQANVAATSGGVSASVRFLDRTPIVLRLAAGGMRGTASITSGGRFPDAPPDQPGRYTHYDVVQPFWSAIVGGEVSVGYRFSRAILMDLAVGLYAFTLPTTTAETGSALQDYTVALPDGPALKGGTAWFVPLNLGIRWDL